MTENMTQVIDADCEHGLSRDLCCGPNHYPSDDQFLYLDDVSERFAGERLEDDDYLDVPTTAELLFSVYGLQLLSSDYCDSPRWHTFNCPNQPAYPF